MVVLIVALLGLLAYSISQTALPVVGTPVDLSGTTNDTGDATTVSNGYQSDGSLTGSLISNDPSTWPGASSLYPNGRVWDICTAVALAEGYNVGIGAAPYTLNNPGDLSPGDEAGQPTQGPPQIHDGSSIIDFATVENGFIALYTKFNNIVTGKSKVYPVTWTWGQVANEYAGDSAAWLANVTNYLGVDPSSTPAQYAAV
jgi:hypothetical protein